MTLEIAVAAYIAYLIGSLSSAIIVCRIYGLPDPRSQGSRNPGATNVLRIGGRTPAAITLAGDFLKGLIPVLFARWYGFDSNIIMLIGFCAFIGHIFPIYYRFEGGKGVATYIGVLFALNWIVAICWVLVWLIMAGIFRYASLASITAALMAPLYMWIFTQDWIQVAALSFMSMIVIIRHSTNISKLKKGEESKIGKKK